MTSHPLLELLSGGNRRSIGASNQAAALALEQPDLLEILFQGMVGEDPVLRMRCADAAEKVTARHPEWLAPFKRPLLDILTCIEQQEVRWHVAPMLVRLPLSAQERIRVAAILAGYADDRSSIVRVQAMQALADLSALDRSLLPKVLVHLHELTAHGTPAMKARGRKLIQRLSRLPPGA